MRLSESYPVTLDSCQDDRQEAADGSSEFATSSQFLLSNGGIVLVNAGSLTNRNMNRALTQLARCSSCDVNHFRIIALTNDVRASA